MATTVKLENRTARTLFVNLGGGDIVEVLPRDPPGPVEIALATDADKARLDRALATAVVQGWIAAGELVVGGGSGPACPPDALTPEPKHPPRGR